MSFINGKVWGGGFWGGFISSSFYLMNDIKINIRTINYYLTKNKQNMSNTETE